MESFSFIIGKECAANAKVDKILKTAFIPPLYEIESCFKRNKELFCHFWHPNCIYKPSKHGYVYFKRHMCKETCESGMAGCDRTRKFLYDAYKINQICQKLPISRRIFQLPKCKDFLQKDTRLIEQCMLIEKSGKHMILSTTTIQNSYFQSVSKISKPIFFQGTLSLHPEALQLSDVFWG